MKRKGPKGFCCEMDCGPYNLYRKYHGKRQLKRDRKEAKKQIKKELK